MLRVNGLYGHIQDNNRKAALLMAVFLVLFVAMQATVWLVPFVGQANLHKTFQQVAHDMAAAPGTFAHTSRPKALAPSPAVPAFMDHPATSAAPPLASAAPPNVSREHLLPADLMPAAGTLNPRRAAQTSSGAPDASAPPWWSGVIARLPFGDWHALLLLLLGLGLLHIVVASWWNSLFIRYAMRAKPLQRKDFPALYNLVENLAMTAGLPCPAIEVIDSPTLNAYASGLSPSHARIGLTTGLITTLDKDEIEAVVAHELTHIRTGDSRLMAVTKACVDLVVPFAGNFTKTLRKSPLSFAFMGFMLFTFLKLTMFLVLGGLIAIITLATYMVKALVLHAREFVADAGAIELTKNPSALISALRKISANDAVPVTNPAAQAMMFSGKAKGLLSTHPDVEDRIAAIREVAAVREGEVEGLRARSQGPLAREAAGGVVFGRRAKAAVTRGGSMTGALGDGRFALASEAAPAWKEAAIFAPAATFTAGADAQQFASGDKPNLFERWIVTGRLERLANVVRSIVLAPFRLWLAFNVVVVFVIVLPMMLLMTLLR